VFDPIGRCPAYVVNPAIAGPALEKEHSDELQYAQLVRSSLPVAPIHSGLDGGMNRVFLAQVGGSLPPARVPPPGSLPPQPAPVSTADNSGSLASKLFGGFFGSKPAVQTQVASTDSATQERGAESATTGSTATPKAKPVPRSETETVAAAKPKSSEPRKSESAKNETPNNDAPKSEPQQAAAVKPKPAPQQEANATPLPGSDNTMNGAQPTVPTGSFDSRWGGLQ
jgi:hypothetical protein